MSSQDRFYSVHGRFQPFHNGHLNYVRAALERCEFLYIGITQVERQLMKVFESAPHRSQLSSNPLSFFERKYLIEKALVSEGISADRFSVIPFPLEKGEELCEFFPAGSVCFTTIHSEWNRTKIDLLQKLGYEVLVLENPDKWSGPRDSATVIRALIRNSDPEWKTLVPKRVAELIEKDFISKFTQET